jgi:hypothetical protein
VRRESPAAARIPLRGPGTRPGVANDRDDQLTPDLPPPVEVPDLWRRPDEDDEGGERPPDPEHGPGDDTASGEPAD